MRFGYYMGEMPEIDLKEATLSATKNKLKLKATRTSKISLYSLFSAVSQYDHASLEKGDDILLAYDFRKVKERI